MRAAQTFDTDAWLVPCTNVSTERVWTDSDVRIGDAERVSGQARYRTRRTNYCGLTDPADDARLAAALDDAAARLGSTGNDLDHAGAPEHADTPDRVGTPAHIDPLTLQCTSAHASTPKHTGAPEHTDTPAHI